jgi:hypothetical protein
MPQIETADAEIDGLIRILERMSDLSSGILQCGMVGDENGTRKLVDQLRQQKALLLLKNRAVGERIQEVPSETMQRTQELLNNISKSEQFVAAWCSRYRGIVDHQTMMESPERYHDLIDEVMPLAWDWKNDILILPNWVTSDFIAAIYARGQKRVCIFEFDEGPRITESPTPFYVNSEKAAFEYFAQSEVYGAARIIYISIATPIDRQNEEYGQQARKLLEDFKTAFVHRIANMNTVRLQGARLLRQGIKNLPAVADASPFSKMIGRFEGVPMVIVSPGPSLDKNIDQLKEFKNQALIVAPAQSALALTSAGVIPDIVLVADPNEMQYLLNGVPMDQVTALILGVTCHPKLYEQYAGKIITFNANLGLDAWISDIFDDTTKLPAGGSVSTDALCMGVFLKCDPIILVGQDLAFSDDKQYASASSDGQVKIVKNEADNTISYTNLTHGLDTILTAGGFDGRTLIEPLRTLPGYYGGTVYTKTDYAIFHTEFQQIAESVKEEKLGIRLLNCTEGGAFIEGFEHVSLCDAKRYVVNKNQQLQITDTLEDILINSNSLIRRQKLHQSLKFICSSLVDTEVLARSCVRLAQASMKDGNLEKLGLEEKKLVEVIQKNPFVSLVAQDQIISALNLGTSAETMADSLSASNILFRVLIDTVGELLPMLEHTMRQLATDAVESSTAF